MITQGKWEFVGEITENKDEDHFYREHATTWLSGPNGEPVLVPWDVESYSAGLHISKDNARLIAAAPDLLAALKGNDNCIPNAPTILSQALLGNYSCVKSMLKEMCSAHKAAIHKAQS